MDYSIAFIDEREFDYKLNALQKNYILIASLYYNGQCLSEEKVAKKLVEVSLTELRFARLLQSCIDLLLWNRDGSIKNITNLKINILSMYCEDNEHIKTKADILNSCSDSALESLKKEEYSIYFETLKAKYQLYLEEYQTQLYLDDIDPISIGSIKKLFPDWVVADKDIVMSAKSFITSFFSK